MPESGGQEAELPPAARAGQIRRSSELGQLAAAKRGQHASRPADVAAANRIERRLEFEKLPAGKRHCRSRRRRIGRQFRGQRSKQPIKSLSRDGAG